MIHEIHITGDASIHEVAKRFNLKTITINLLAPTGEVIKTEHMTSLQMHFSSIKTCFDYVRDMVEVFNENNVDVSRVKIEVPPDKNLLGFARYVEMHTPTQTIGAPKSVNLSNLKILYTQREYNPAKYKEFIEYYRQADENAELELAILDSKPQEDLAWFELYKELS